MNSYATATPRLAVAPDADGALQLVQAGVRLAARPAAPAARTRYRHVKRVVDIVVCAALLPVLTPVMLVVAALIYLESPGKVLFFQWRTGRGGVRFKMFKFRTMVPNAERLKPKYAHLNELPWPDFKITDDPRVTWVGRFLRKTSLDELPQLFNVLRGEMSLVGPRPTSFDIGAYELVHTERLEVLPGITGLWQITGRANVDFDERLQMDIQYIENQSFAYDMRILLLTVSAVLNRRGAV